VEDKNVSEQIGEKPQDKEKQHPEDLHGEW
jgi:hypothetical protein